MGMFDTLKDIELRCPYCGGRDCSSQTKDLDCFLGVYHVHYDAKDGDFDLNKDGCGIGCTSAFSNVSKDQHAYAPEDVTEITGIASCDSPVCKAFARMEDLVNMSYTSGFTRCWHVSYAVDPKNHRVVGPAKITHTKPGTYPEMRKKFIAWLDTHHKAAAKFQPILEAHGGDYGLAVLSFHYGLTNEEWEEREK